MRANAPASTGSHPTGGDAIFGCVLVGIDETPESLIAAVQGGVLRAPGGRLVLLAVAETYLATHAGMAAADAGDRLLDGTSTDLARAEELVEADDAVLVPGHLVHVLRAECSRRGATLVAVGVQPHRRLAALTFGGHDVEALHDAPCSVLIARPGWGAHKPVRIVVGVDGSPEARAAEEVARSLALRLGCDVVPVVSLGQDVDPEVLRAEREDVLLDPRPLDEAVAGASDKRSLIVVGRGREHGRRWRGSFVERVVYSARCSVLVVQHEPRAVA
jgi:nucleotide-binding universal stress UspA family protein